MEIENNEMRNKVIRFIDMLITELLR
jgi:hypothetical protein